ncbi:MAG: carbon-nitrogen hydrolase family protein [Rhizomicrobium sp.]
MTEFRAACLQMNSGADRAENFDSLQKLAHEARAAGAEFLATPENSLLMAPDADAKLAQSFSESDDPLLPRLTALAVELRVWLLIGSLAIKIRPDKTVNRSLLIAPDGQIMARYDKIHLFDVSLPSGERYRESNTVEGGARAVNTRLPWGRVGFSICYDVRFPQLYRTLGQAGAIFITVPAAFTKTTGKAHWHVLLRARAIETGSFIIAPAQCGSHPGGRQTYGHSLIVSPWGEVLAEGGESPAVVLADINPALAYDARARVPSLIGDRQFL